MKRVLYSSSSFYLRRRTPTNNNNHNVIGGTATTRHCKNLSSNIAIRNLLYVSSSPKPMTVPIPPLYSSKRRFSEATVTEEPCSSNTGLEEEEERPSGTLFPSTTTPHKLPMGPELIGARGMIRRTFGPRSNAEGLLATGGPDLAAHASFDPDYHRAQDWIRHHAVGPAVLSPILISGLTGALTEAAFPHGVITYQSMKHLRPLIVGVPVASIIEVINVTKAERIKSTTTTTTMESSPSPQSPSQPEDENDCPQRTHGYDVTLRTIVSRIRDDCIIAEGIHELWVPDYLHM